MPTHRILRLPQVRETTGLSRTTIYSQIKKGLFPAPVKLGERASGWLEGDICAWIESRRTLSIVKQ